MYNKILTCPNALIIENPSILYKTYGYISTNFRKLQISSVTKTTEKIWRLNFWYEITMMVWHDITMKMVLENY